MNPLFAFALVAGATEPQVLRDRLATFDAHATYRLPALTDAQLQDLLEGKVVKVREVDPAGPQRVTGLLIAPVPKDALYVSVSDPHLAAVDHIHEAPVPTGPGPYPVRWLQLLDLPRPFADRHWVVDVTDNVAMHEATGGAAWEHWWTLAPDGPTIAGRLVAEGQLPGVSQEMLTASVYVPHNTGAFVYVDVPGGTLFGFHATSTVGGNIPDRMVAQYTLATVGRMLKNVVERVPEACAHYDAGHAPLLGGHGRHLPKGCAGR